MKTKTIVFNVQEPVTEPEISEEELWTKFRIFKNLAVICAGVFLYLSAALPSLELQSSLNFKDGLGTYSNSIGAAINIIPCILLPPYCIRRFGLKTCIVVAILLGSLSYFGNFYPRPWTLIPSAILANMGISPMWTAKGTYITYMAEKYAKIAGIPTQSSTNLFFGIFYSCYYSGYIFGNLLPYYLLKRPNEINHDNSLCGNKFCDSFGAINNTNFERPPDQEVYLLFGIFFGITVAGAMVILIFLDNLKVTYTTEASLIRALDSIFILKRWDQWCMCCISLYRGANRALLTADFTKAYITCTWGINHIGYIMISFGVGCGICSITLGYLVRWLGRPILFFLAVVSNVAIMMTMIFWQPNPNQPIVFFSLVVIWGASNAVWESQVAALNHILYPNNRDAAYTNYSNAEVVGTAVGLGVSSTLCTYVKTYANLVILGFAAASYTALEIGPLQRANQNIENERIQMELKQTEQQNGVLRLNGQVGIQRKLTGYPRHMNDNETQMERF